MKVIDKLQKARNIQEGDVVLYGDAYNTLGLVVDAGTGFAIYDFKGNEMVRYKNCYEIDFDTDILNYWKSEEVVMTLELMTDAHTRRENLINE